MIEKSITDSCRYRLREDAAADEPHRTGLPIPSLKCRHLLTDIPSFRGAASQHSRRESDKPDTVNIVDRDLELDYRTDAVPQ